MQQSVDRPRFFDIAPNNSVTTASYVGLATSVTNDLSQTNTRINNARGELAQVIDSLNQVTAI